MPRHFQRKYDGNHIFPKVYLCFLKVRLCSGERFRCVLCPLPFWNYTFINFITTGKFYISFILRPCTDLPQKRIKIIFASSCYVELMQPLTVLYSEIKQISFDEWKNHLHDGISIIWRPTGKISLMSLNIKFLSYNYSCFDGIVLTFSSSTECVTQCL